MKFIDLSGQRFGLLTVTSRAPNKPGGRAMWNCKCDCGHDAVVQAANLRNGHSRSCGCQSAIQEKTHGLGGTPTHRVWAGMLARCFNKNRRAYPDYGGRGITVCERWRKFENFLADMGTKPDGMTLERENNDGNCEPGNCVWATVLQQCNNRRSNRMVTIDGSLMTLSSACRRYGTYHSLVRRRELAGWDIEAAIKTPVNRRVAA